MLRSKHRNSQEEWEAGFRRALEAVDTTESKLRYESLVSLAISRIPKTTLVWGWSGGKDSIALESVMEKVDSEGAVLGRISERYEFPEFVKFCDSKGPRNLHLCEIEVTPSWLNSHSSMVFPTDSKNAYRWFQKQNQKAYYSFADEKEASAIVLGHRVADGNVCGGGSMGKKVFPLYDFSHEDVFCMIAQSGKVLPATYYYPSGFDNGSSAWIQRRGGEKGMDEVYSIDSDLLESNRDIEKIDDYLIRKGV